jgi:hypothetical protein
MTEDAATAIREELCAQRRRRRTRFGLSALLATSGFGGIVAVWARPDLWDQPWPQLAGQIALWVLGLLVLPAIGVGLWFPGRMSSGSVALLTLLAIVLATGSGWPAPALDGEPTRSGSCAGIVGLVGAAGIGLALSSGAFIQCRRRASTLWLAAAIGVLALVAPLWVCTGAAQRHVWTDHLGFALVVAIAAAGLGRWMGSTRVG